MGKLDAYNSGRNDGLIMAYRLVKEDGLKALEEELNYRNVTSLNCILPKKEMKALAEKIKTQLFEVLLVLSVSTLHDEFDFGKKRCDRFVERMLKISNQIEEHYATLDDYRRMLEDELHIELEIKNM